MSRFTKWVLPTFLIVLALVGINLGFYAWLAPGTGLIPPVLPFVAKFDAESLNSWQTFGGDWQPSQGYLFQRRSGQQYFNIYAPLKLPPQQAYHLRAELKVYPGSSAGLLFNVFYPLFQSKSQFVFIKNDNGQLSVSGGYFLNSIPHSQVEAPVTAGPAVHLNVLVDRFSYTLYANEQLIAQDIPLFYQGGGIGLSSLGSGMAFNSLTADNWQSDQAVTLVPFVTPTTTQVVASPTAQGTNPAPELPALGQLATISGTWIQIGDQVRQTATEQTDFAAGTVFSGDNYSLSTQVVSDAGSKGGAGFLLNMVDHTVLTGASAVRLMDSGHEIVWGYFSIGEFVSQGHKVIDTSGTSAPVLKVTVSNGAYSVFVNDSLVAANVRLVNPSGFVGLTSYGGPVSFNRISLSLGG